MPAVLDSLYAQWRVRCGVAPLLHDDNDSPPERLLQAIWQHQRVRRDQLTTLEGQPLRVLHPGFHSVESGPDFRGAVVQIGDGPVQSGDVEVDLRAGGWRAHKHDRNPAFNQVVLHVVWDSETRSTSESAPPRMALRSVLDAPLGELSLWLSGDTIQSFPDELRGQCCAPLRGLEPAQLVELLHQAAQVRLRSKAAQFQARARQAGWEQSLWEGLFRALGYKHNVWPMQRLAELRSRWSAAPLNTLIVQARLLGLSGLLPAELTRTQAGTDTYLRDLWDRWWRERDELGDGILPREVWRLHGLRPANHPQRRLALASGWCVAGDIPARLQAWCLREETDGAAAVSLLAALQAPPDAFWSWHWTLRSARLKHAQPLLGATRVTDLAVNVVLPWLWIRASEGGSEAVRRRLEACYFNWPAAEDNSLLRLARQRLLGGAGRRALPGAAAQQGLLQIVHDCCDHSNALCRDCKLPELVREFAAERKAVPIAPDPGARA